MNVIGKNSLPNLFSEQAIPNSIVGICSMYLTYEKYSPIQSVLSVILLFFYAYFIHKKFHFMPDLINLHMKYHHNKIIDSLEKNMNLIIETVVNIVFFLIFYLFQKLIHIQFVPTVIIFFYGFIYVSIHIINYSIFHIAEKHIKHHNTSNPDGDTVNYGPDLADHLFGTNSDESFENYNHILPNTLISLIISYFIFVICY